MKSHLTDVWHQWRDPNLKTSEAIKELSAIVGSELSRDSTEADVRAHIKRHFQNPNFEVRGVPAMIWSQNANGHPPFLLGDDFRILTVNYHCMHGRFLQADLSVQGGASEHVVGLTPRFNPWEVLRDKPNFTSD